MADKEFMAPRRGGTATEQRLSARVATTDGTRNDAGYGRGGQGGPTAVELRAHQIGGGRGNVNPPFVKPDDNYSHEANNIVPSGTVNPNDLNIKIQPNILDNYDAVTYHFKLFITDPVSSSTGDIFTIKNQTIIAETGITDLTIDNVEIRSLVTPSVESGTGVFTNIKFEITEPSGAGLIDKLFYQSVALGIGNWATMPFYLQLQFKNRDAATSEPDDGALGDLAILKWFYSIKLSQIKASVSSVGTKYEFIGAPYNEYALSNAISSLRHNTTLDNLDNFEDAMAKLQDKLNADQMTNLLFNYSIPDSFRIIVDSDLAGAKITPVDKNTNSRRHDNFVTFENKDASFSYGTTIDKVIDSLLANTDYYQEGMLRAETAGQSGVPITQESNQMKDFWRIVVETRPLQFDPVRLTVANEYTIFVVKYDIGILDDSVFQTVTGPSTLEAARRRLATYIKKNILKKKYDYIFTGMNDQIIEFDLTINNAFAVSNSRFSGVYSNSAMSTKGVTTHDHALEETNVRNAILAAISLQHNTKSENTRSASYATAGARDAIEKSNLPEATKKRFSVILEQSKPESRMSFIKDVQTRGGLNNDGTLSESRTKATNLAKPISEKISQQQFNFISDVDIESQAAKSAYTNLMENSRGKLRPVAIFPNFQDQQIGLGVESNSNSGLQKLSNMFSVALHSNMDNTFQKIKMKIKGDPFWLYPQPTVDDKEKFYNSLKTPEEAIKSIKQKIFNNFDAANFFGTDNFLIIRFRSPRIYNLDENPDSDNPNVEIETFSGIYKAVEIKSIFNAGKFTQDIEANIDPELRMLDIKDQIEAISAIKQTATEPLDLKKQFELPLPLSAIKTQRIMGTLDIKGIENQTRTLTGQVQELGSKTVGQAVGSLSNVPDPANLTPDEILIRRGINLTGPTGA